MQKTQRSLNTNSTNGLTLFTAQDEGLLVGYVAVYTAWVPPAVGLRHPVYPVIHPGPCSLPVTLHVHTCNAMLKYVLWVTQ